MSKGYAELARRLAAANPEVADHRVIAELMLAELEREQERELLGRLLPGYVRSVLGRRSAGESDEQIWSGFLEERMPDVSGEMIFARQAGADDLDAAAERRFTFAGRLDRRGQQFKAVAEALRDSGQEVLGALVPAVGVASLAGLERDVRTVRSQRVKLEPVMGEADRLRGIRDALAARLAADEPGPGLLWLEERRRKIAEELMAAIWSRREHEILRDTIREATVGSREA